MPEPRAAELVELRTISRQRPAMGTLFEVCLRGPDEEHLAAVADAILDEITRVERLLSRFDPRSEISRIHRTGTTAPVLLDVEVNQLLALCEQAFHATSGAFDVTRRTDSPARAQWLGVVFDPAQRLLQLTTQGVEFDLGGIGKGYALDRAINLLDEFGIEHALLHGGTSSVYARGHSSGDSPWLVTLTDPWKQERDIDWPLADSALSCSAVDPDQPDIVDPHTGAPLTAPAGCIVEAPSATIAEILSTAALCWNETVPINDYLACWGPGILLSKWQPPGTVPATTHYSTDPA